jgi:hypothetical protein
MMVKGEFAVVSTDKIVPEIESHYLFLLISIDMPVDFLS